MRDLLVLGSGRSGTSMVAGTLAASGWWVGDDPYPGRAANPKGFFETAEINGINEELLARVLPAQPRFEHGQRWLCTLPAGAEPRADAALDARIARLAARRPFAFKDPRLCYTLEAWRPHLPEGTGCVCVFRDPLATAASIVKECREAPYLAGLAMDSERALEIWCAMYERVLEHARRGEWLFLHYDQMLTQDGLARLECFAGARLDRRFPEASLRRAQPQSPSHARADELYRELCARAGHADRARVAAAVPVALPPGTPELSVILCTYQRLPILQRAIASFEAQDAPAGSFELVVVDDGSSDGTHEWLDAHAFGVPARVLHKPNGGLASARNVGIQAARGKLLLFVNDDTLAFPDLVREHLAAHAQAAADGRELSVLGSFEQPSAHLASALMRHLELSGEVFRYQDMRAGELYDHNRFWTCNVSVPAARVREAGLFDERFRRYGCEDIDLGLRLERLGLRVQYHPGARAHHDHVLDFAALKKRQLSCSASFVHLFAKHPSELDHPDWSWLAGRSSASMRAELHERAERRARLESAVATLARIELPELEALGESALVESTLARLRALLGELNALWWQEGLVQGLAELELPDFESLRAREPATRFGGLRSGAFTPEEARTQLELVRREAESGASALATLRAIELAAALEPRGAEGRALLVETLSDLAVLRHAQGDSRAALALLERALELAPEHALARENRRAIEAAPAAALPAPARATDLLEQARSRARLVRARVLAFAAPAGEEFVRANAVRSWAAVEDAQGLAAAALGEASIDVAIVGRAPLERREGEALARELARVVRPGGRVLVDWSRTWFDAQGAELLQPGIGLPDFAHLLLDARTLGWYAARVHGAAAADALLARLGRLDPLPAEELARACAAAGFDTGALEGGSTPPAEAALRRELARCANAAGALAGGGCRGLLVRRGRTVVIGQEAASAAGA